MKAREKTIPTAGGGELRIPDALDRLIDLYTATDRLDEVKKWRAERTKYPTLAPPPHEKK
jgi:eukaryotic-like serine/threonine-protein kinase